MDIERIVFAIGVFALVFAVCVVAWWVNRPSGYAERATRRALSRAPRVPIATYPDGVFARVVGRIVCREHLSAPLTGRTCVFYDAIVEVYQGDSDTDIESGSWQQLIRETRGVPFAVDDGTGVATVDPEGAKLAIEHDERSRSGYRRPPTALAEAFLACHDERSEHRIITDNTDLRFRRRLRYREGVLQIGDTVAVYGVGVHELDADSAARAAGYREAPPTRLRLMSSPQAPLLIGDRP
jgi:hypothetical protein